jgi:hypothetical protein
MNPSIGAPCGTAGREREHAGAPERGSMWPLDEREDCWTDSIRLPSLRGAQGEDCREEGVARCRVAAGRGVCGAAEGARKVS